MGLTDVYHAYLRCLNERRWNELGEFVSAELTYNERQMTLDDYRRMLQADAESIPDLQCVADFVVADGHAVGSPAVLSLHASAALLGVRADRWTNVVRGARLLPVRRHQDHARVVGHRHASDRLADTRTMTSARDGM
jgi:predicted ester cyclase